MKATIPFISWTLLVTYLSLAPVYEASTYKYIPHEDKLGHFVMYFIMSVLLSLILKRNALAQIFSISALYGFLMEILQYCLKTGRTFDYLDILANIFGAFAGTMLIYVLNKYK